jgi:hypothetical protein
MKNVCMKKIIFCVLAVSAVLSFISCSRGITPYEAANGKEKCGRYIK